MTEVAPTNREQDGGVKDVLGERNYWAWRWQRLGDRECLEMFVKSFYGYALRHAQNYSWSCLPFEDRVQEGLVAICKAASEVDTLRSKGLSTFIWHRVGWAISRACARESDRNKRGAGTQGSDKRYRVPYEVSLDSNWLIGSAREAYECSDIEDSGAEDDRHFVISEAFSVLTDREREVVRERFWCGMTLDDVGAGLPRHARKKGTNTYGVIGSGVSRERVRQIEVKALRKLRRAVSLMGVTIEDVTTSAQRIPYIHNRKPGEDAQHERALRTQQRLTWWWSGR